MRSCVFSFAVWILILVAFVTRRDAPPQVVWLGPADPINAAVVAWRENSGAGISATAGQSLRGLMWEPLEPHREGAAVSLWKVRDDATRSLMARFYENLWRHKLSRAAAMRQVQRTTMRDPGRRGAAPVGDGDASDRLPTRDWAAFVVSGDWR